MLASLFYYVNIYLKTISLADIFIPLWGFIFFIIILFFIKFLPERISIIKIFLTIVLTFGLVGGSYYFSQVVHNYYKGVKLTIKDSKRLIFDNSLLINFSITNVGKKNVKKCYYRFVVSYSRNILKSDKIHYNLMTHPIERVIKKIIKVDIKPNETLNRQDIYPNFNLKRKFKIKADIKCL